VQKERGKQRQLGDGQDQVEQVVRPAVVERHGDEASRIRERLPDDPARRPADCLVTVVEARLRALVEMPDHDFHVDGGGRGAYECDSAADEPSAPAERLPDAGAGAHLLVGRADAHAGVARDARGAAVPAEQGVEDDGEGEGGQGNRWKSAGRRGETVRVREGWTLARRGSSWVLQSIEEGAEGAHAIDEQLVSTPWAEERSMRDEALIEGALADALPDGTNVADVAALTFEGSARAAALDLSLVDGRFAPDVLEVAARRAVEAWAEAVDGEDGALLELANRDAARQGVQPSCLPCRPTRVRRTADSIPTAGPFDDEVAKTAVLVLHVGEKAQQAGDRHARGRKAVSAPQATVQDDGTRGIVDACDALEALFAC